MIDAALEALTGTECLHALQSEVVGRIAFLVDGAPMLVPVNYRVVETPRGPLLMIRTRPGTQLDQAPRPVAFEVGGEDPVRRVGWSVVVRGNLAHLETPDRAARRALDPTPWIEHDRTSWLVLEPVVITGRRLIRPEEGWGFHVRGYV